MTKVQTRKRDAQVLDEIDSTDVQLQPGKNDTVQPEIDNDLERFCQQLVDHAQFKVDREFRTGSSVEIVGHQSSLRDFQLSDEYLDVDYMVFNTRYYALPQGQTMPVSVNCCIYWINTEGIHPGYARLSDAENRQPEMVPSNLHEIEAHQIPNGPARKLSKRSYMGAEFDIIPYQDIVQAIHCPLWPPEASEWVKRSRQYGSPSNSVIRKVIRYGCDFVKVSHSRIHPDEREWRFSFSKAELIIIRSWTELQRVAYSTLHVIGKLVADKLAVDKLGRQTNKKKNRKKTKHETKLCTYYFKTLMLWAFEERPAEFWSEESLIDSIIELLVLLTNLLVIRTCLNYFIPTNNMMDHLHGTDLFNYIDALNEIIQAPEKLERIIWPCKRLEKLSCHTTYHIELPKWIKRAVTIHERIQCIQDKYNDLFKTMTGELQADIYAEFCDIFSGLRVQQQATCCVDVSKKDGFVLAAQEHFLFATNLYGSSELCILHTRNASFANNVIASWYLKCDPPVLSEHKKRLEFENATDTEHSSENDSEPRPVSNKISVYNRSDIEENCKTMEDLDTMDIEKIDKSKDCIIACHWSCHTDPSQPPITGASYCKIWPEKSPTVNISWFNAMAYLANLQFTDGRDTTSIVRICDEIISVYQGSYWNNNFAERTFPVICSTEFTSIYDHELQEMLGFYSLGSFLIDTHCRRRSVYMGFCLIQFALYLKLRCSLRKGDQQHGNLNGLDPYICAEEYMKHDKVGVCTGDFKVINGAFALNTALENSDIIFRMNK